MSLKIELDFKDLEKLNKLAKPFKDSRFSNILGAKFRDNTVNRFKKEVSPKGNKWRKSIRARADSGNTLVDTAILRNSVTYNAGKNSVAWGSNVPYARTVQDGTNPKSSSRRRRRKNKAFNKKYYNLYKRFGGRGRVNRPWLGLSKKDISDYNKLLKEFLTGKVK